METKLNITPIDFKFSDYLSQGFEILKKDYGKFLGAFLITVLMSIIPFCSLLAFGNFYKFSHKTFKGEQTSASDIFNFDDFLPYFYLFLIVIGAILVLEIPILLIAFSASNTADSLSPLTFVIPFYVVLLVAIIFYFTLKGFYIPALISVVGIKDIKTAWKMSNQMTKGNLLFIFLFTLVVSFLSQIGIILCFIGVLLTLPYSYICQFLAFDDAINKIKYDDIQEIGSNSN